MEPGFNNVAGDWVNLFIKLRVHYIKNLDIAEMRGNDQNVHFIEGQLMIDLLKPIYKGSGWVPCHPFQCNFCHSSEILVQFIVTVVF